MLTTRNRVWQRRPRVARLRSPRNRRPRNRPRALRRSKSDTARVVSVPTYLPGDILRPRADAVFFLLAASLLVDFLFCLRIKSPGAGVCTVNGPVPEA